MARPSKAKQANVGPVVQEPEQVAQLLAATKELELMTDDEARAAFDDPEKGPIYRLAVLIFKARQMDTPRAFEIFFTVMHGIPLHSEGRKWIKNAYEAHKEGKGLLQKCHRESGKTTVFSKFFMAWRIGKEPHKVNAIVRINDDKANETTAAIAHMIMYDPRWNLFFPHVKPDLDRGWGAMGYFVKNVGMLPEEWSKMVTQSPDGPSLVGYGWKSGSIIGSRVNGMLIVDDICDEENTSSDRQMQSVIKFYTDTLSFVTMQGAWEVWNFTPWKENDVYAYAESTGRYLVSTTPVMVSAQEGEDGAQFWEKDPEISYSGRWWKLYWPEVWDFARIKAKYVVAGVVGFARMMLCDLEMTKGINLKTEWLHRYPASQVNPSWPVIFGVDYASTADQQRAKATDRDYFAMAICRAIPGGGIVLMDGYMERISKGEALDLVIAYWGMYPTLFRIGVENIGKGEEFYNDLLLTKDLGGKVPPLMAIQHGRRSKGDRFENWLAPRFQASRIWVSDTPSPFISKFMDQWSLWPNASHDDAIDAVYMCAFAAEGFLPNKAERSFNKVRKVNPLVSFGRS